MNRIDFMVTQKKLEDGRTQISGMRGDAEVALELCAKMEEILAQDAFVGFTDEELAKYVRHLFKYGQHINEHDGPIRDIKHELSIASWTRWVD